MSRIIFRILLIILLIFMAAPLLGALVLIAAGAGMMQQMPDIMNEQMIGLATIWILLVLVLILSVIVSTAKSLKRAAERDKAA